MSFIKGVGEGKKYFKIFDEVLHFEDMDKLFADITVVLQETNEKYNISLKFVEDRNKKKETIYPVVEKNRFVLYLNGFENYKKPVENARGIRISSGKSSIYIMISIMCTKTPHSKIAVMKIYKPVFKE